MSDAVPEPEAQRSDGEPAQAHAPEHDPAAPAPLGVPRTPTGNAEVDAGWPGWPTPTTSPRTDMSRCTRMYTGGCVTR